MNHKDGLGSDSVAELETCIKSVDETLDYESAAEAFSALASIDPPRASRVALEILSLKLGDPIFQASAFDKLYLIDQPMALRYIEEHVDNSDLTIFKEMIESVTVDSVVMSEEPEKHPDYFNAVRQIENRIENGETDLSDRSDSEIARFRKSVEWFRSSFKVK